MCVVSAITDSYRPRYPIPGIWPDMEPIKFPDYPRVPFKTNDQEFLELKKDIERLKELLKVAKKFDEDTGQIDCEKDEKIALVKAVAKYVGVDLSEVI